MKNPRLVSMIFENRNIRSRIFCAIVAVILPCCAGGCYWVGEVWGGAGDIAAGDVLDAVSVKDASDSETVDVIECVPACQDGYACRGGECQVCIPDCTGIDCGTDPECGHVCGTCQEAERGEKCVMGKCLSPCELARDLFTNEGCEYWAIDMEQYKKLDSPYSGEDAPFAVVISNINDRLTATVTVYQAGKLVRTVEAAPRAATIIDLDSLNINGTGITDKTYHIKSNLPIVAYQFNPLENVGVLSNDASLLLPTNVLGDRYRVMAMPSIGYNEASQFLSGLISIVAVEEGETVVKITPTTNLNGDGGVPTIPVGGSDGFTLNQGQVANIKTDTVAYSDLTGTLVEADKKIAVFSGHVCGMAPISTCVDGRCSYDKEIYCDTDSPCPAIMACDHLEEQVQPITAWGYRYVVPKTKARGLAPDLVRFVANEADTRVTVTPPVVGYKPLNAGEVHEFEIKQSVVVESDKPILVALVLEGEAAPGSAHVFCVDSLDELCTRTSGTNCTCSDDNSSCETAADCSDDAGIGDPSLIMAVPVNQYRDRYVFLAPTKYTENFISVTAPTGANVTLDGQSIQAVSFYKITNTSYMTAVMGVQAGSHVLESDKPVGLYVYGWDTFVSYGYPGGMMLYNRDLE